MSVPVQRAEKLLMVTLPPGERLPQLKSTASVRVSTGVPLSVRLLK